jgi:hypothetical protein
MGGPLSREWTKDGARSIING